VSVTGSGGVSAGQSYREFLSDQDTNIMAQSVCYTGTFNTGWGYVVPQNTTATQLSVYGFLYSYDDTCTTPTYGGIINQPAYAPWIINEPPPEYEYTDETGFASSTFAFPFITWGESTSTGNGSSTFAGLSTIQTHVALTSDKFPSCVVTPLIALGNIFNAAANGTALKQVLLIHQPTGTYLPVDWTIQATPEGQAVYETKLAQYVMSFLWFFWSVWIVMDIYHWIHPKQPDV
jgi:hypothetical protein